MRLSLQERYPLEARAGGNPITNQMQTEHRSHLFMFTLLNTSLLCMTSLEMWAPRHLIHCTGADVYLYRHFWGCRSRDYCTLKTACHTNTSFCTQNVRVWWYILFMLWFSFWTLLYYYGHTVALGRYLYKSTPFSFLWKSLWISFLWKSISAAAARRTSCHRITRTFLKAIADAFSRYLFHVWRTPKQEENSVKVWSVRTQALLMQAPQLRIHK